MTVEVGGVNLSVRWKHFEKAVRIRKDIISKQHTQCSIFVTNPSVPFVNKIAIGTGISHCSQLDNFNKEKGRKLSLTRALKASGLDKKSRSKIWEIYFNRKTVPV